MKINKGISACVFGVKGGTGKTTLLLNLAGLASLQKKKVLMVDFDLSGGSIALHTDKLVNKTLYNFQDDYNNNRFDNIRSYVTEYNEFIDFIACPKDPRQASKIDSKYVNILIEKAIFQYDLVLIDMSHSLDGIVLSILDKVDKILFNITNDLYDVKNARNMISIFNDLNIDKYKIVLNKSIYPNRNPFSNYDIKCVIKSNIDYIISDKMYLKNYDDYVLNGKIYTLCKEFLEKQNEGKKVFDLILKDTLKECD